jgi:hypothetical protein
MAYYYGKTVKKGLEERLCKFDLYGYQSYLEFDHLGRLVLEYWVLEQDSEYLLLACSLRGDSTVYISPLNSRPLQTFLKEELEWLLEKNVTIRSAPSVKQKLSPKFIQCILKLKNSTPSSS